jgi:hypothetical protein
MSNEWSFRDEILSATQRWPWLALFCVLGSLLGGAISFGWPTPHRATRELYVGLNVYRSIEDQNVSEYAGIELVNANDYKNWQMASLNSLIFMDNVIDETLMLLRDLDPYWQDINTTELANSLNVYWRNAGKWRLVAENKDPTRAVQAVTTWQDVVVEHVHAAVLASQQAMVLEFQLRALADNKTRMRAEIDLLRTKRQDLEVWRGAVASRSPGSPVEASEHWGLWQVIASSDQDANLIPLLDAFPSSGSVLQDYIEWSETAFPAIDLHIEALEKQAQDLDVQEQETGSLFAQASQKSLGLSATLDVDKISGSRTQQMVTRPTGMLMLAGSLLGLIVWLVLWFGSISLRGEA